MIQVSFSINPFEPSFVSLSYYFSCTLGLTKVFILKRCRIVLKLSHCSKNSSLSQRDENHLNVRSTIHPKTDHTL